MDSPKGDYARRKGEVFPTAKQINILNMDSPKGDYTRSKGLVFSTDIYIYIYMAIYGHI